MGVLRLLFIAVVCWTISVPCFAKRHIKLEGRRNRLERSLKPNPSIEAWIEDNGKELSLCFYQDLGQVNVMVTSLSGEVVYSECVESAKMLSLVILLDRVSEEEYTLSIMNNSNEVSGKFSIY